MIILFNDPGRSISCCSIPYSPFYPVIMMNICVKSDLNLATGQRMKNFRIQKGWRQDVPARLLDISVPAYSKMESGATDINLSRLEKIAVVYGVELISLLADHPEKEIRSEKLCKLEKLVWERENEIIMLRRKMSLLSRELKGPRLILRESRSGRPG